MAKVYLSYSGSDRAAAITLSESLKDNGHEIIMDVDSLLPGQDISSTLFQNLRKSDFMIVLISDNSNNSKWVMSEIGAALSYSSERPQFSLIPVVLGEPEIPDTIKHKLYLQSISGNIEEVIPKILESMSLLLGRREARKEKSDNIKRSTDDYIKSIISDLEIKQKNSKRTYYLWNVIGFLFLAGSAVYLLSNVSFTSSPVDMTSLVYSLIKTGLALSFTVACSRYSFLMSKIALDESMTLGERIHAISFGKIFIQMFSDEFTKDEMYKVFENWNTSPQNATERYKTDDYDPNLLKVFKELVESIKK
ncbi:TIR domain-containing protein [Vibrio sp. B513a]|uniref:toll/interleukin-1 receptor domain-containing protein n=1 Tax=Vibrio TaxID=662 RepID=UPI000CE996CE|nr:MULTISPECIES: toll/interleukin-1 receptor domain-containing protein [Vibrio]AVF65947.1 hypothetical protein AL541_17050 [Vibrio alginolyticus]MBT0004876.1 toll/interleukin-1 receptor domain-containing protein [Vibrio alginolyticus]MDK9749419.1 TIR domain-containing protein [Vibrio sp. B513a]BCG18063.1 hypothetical protein HLBS07_19150 [Vibrio alginolyticus]